MPVQWQIYSRLPSEVKIYLYSGKSRLPSKVNVGLKKFPNFQIKVKKTFMALQALNFFPLNWERRGEGAQGRPRSVAHNCEPSLDVDC